MSLDVHPSFSADYYRDGPERDTEGGGKIDQSLGAVTSANFPYLFFGEPGATVVSADRAWHSPFGHFIGHVVVIGSAEQVSGINTGRIIAGMEDVGAGGDFACQTITEPVRANEFSIDAKMAVAFGVSGTAPQPTVAGLIDEFPKSHLRRLAHSDNSTRGATLCQ